MHQNPLVESRSIKRIRTSERISSLHGALIYSIFLGTLLPAFTLLVFLRLAPPPLLVVAGLAYSGLCLAVGTWLWIKREKVNHHTISALFVVLVLGFLLLAWIWHSTFVNLSPVVAGLYFGNKTAVILVAVLRPGRGKTNLYLMGALVAEAIVMWEHFGFSTIPEMHYRLEPWLSVLSWILAFGLYAARAYRFTLLRRMICSEVKSEVLEQVARLFLSLRDLSNTPLQTLGLGIDLLRERYPKDREFLTHLENAQGRLKKLDTYLQTEGLDLRTRAERLETPEDILERLK